MGEVFWNETADPSGRHDMIKTSSIFRKLHWNLGFRDHHTGDVEGK